MIAEQHVPGAWCHTRHVVLTTALLATLSDDEVEAVLAHELWHWGHGDAAALTFVAAVSWPVTALYNLAAYLGGQRLGSVDVQQPNFGRILAWFLFWPAWILTRLVIAPAAAGRQRKLEFEADKAAARAGLGHSLTEVLQKIGPLEPGRTGFEALISRSHPSIELRIDRLRPRQPNDSDFEGDELGLVTARRAKLAAAMVTLFGALLVGGGALLNHLGTGDNPLANYPHSPSGAEQAGMAFTQQFIGPNAESVQTLIKTAVPPKDQFDLTSEYRQLAAGYNTAASTGVQASITASPLGCEVGTAGNDSVAQVALHETFAIHAGTYPTTDLDNSVMMNLEWTSFGWEVIAFSYRPLGTTGWPTSFQSCP